MGHSGGSRLLRDAAHVTLALVVGATVARADPHDGVRSALVFVTAKAVQKSGPCTGCEVASRATGFLVDGHGVVATSYHLLTKLGDYDDATLEVHVVTGGENVGVPRAAAPEYFDVRHDVLTLRIAEGASPFPHLTVRGSPRQSITLAATPIYTSGFPEGYPYLSDAGHVRAYNGSPPDLYLWVTNMEFKPGQSGSPIYLDDGSVIGIVKGSERDSARNTFFVPAQYLERLVPPAAEDTPDAAAAGVVHIVEPTEETRSETRWRSRTFAETNAPCADPKPLAWRVTPTEGWRVEVDTIDLEPRRVSPGSQVKKEPHDAGEHGFTIRALLENTGQCLRDGERLVTEDAPGVVEVVAHYRERRTVTTTRETNLLRAPLPADGVLTQRLPSSEAAFTVFVERPGRAVERFDAPADDGDVVVERRGPELVVASAETATSCGQLLQLPAVTFEAGSATLPKEARATLDQTVDTLAACPGVPIGVVGYADSSGPLARNLELSYQRALTVRDYLETRGIAPERLEPAGLGTLEPVAGNHTSFGRAMNRRVELRSLY